MTGSWSFEKPSFRPWNVNPSINVHLGNLGDFSHGVNWYGGSEALLEELAVLQVEVLEGQLQREYPLRLAVSTSSGSGREL